MNTGAVLLASLAPPDCATVFEPATGGPGTTFGKVYVDTPKADSRTFFEQSLPTPRDMIRAK